VVEASAEAASVVEVPAEAAEVPGKIIKDIL
jgi:hypothetical protein